MKQEIIFCEDLRNCMLNLYIDEKLPNNVLQQHISLLPRYLINISPENKNSLYNEFYKGLHVYIKSDGNFICECLPRARIINLSIGTLARLWAFCFGVYTITQTYVVGKNLTKSSMRFQKYDISHPLTCRALQAIRIAEKKGPIDESDYLIINRIYKTWGKHKVFIISEEIFRICLAYVCLHEIAHITLRHGSHVDRNIQIQNEKEADQWAFEHVLAPVKHKNATCTKFLKRSIGVAYAHLFLVFSKITGCKDEVKFEEESHPATYKRLYWALNNYLEDYDKNDDIWGYIFAVLSITTSDYRYLQPDEGEEFGTYHEAVLAFLSVFSKYD